MPTIDTSVFSTASYLSTPIKNTLMFVLPLNSASVSNDLLVPKGYYDMMNLAKSKLISCSPDYFACSTTNANNRLREPVNAGASAGAYGYCSLYTIVPPNTILNT